MSKFLIFRILAVFLLLVNGTGAIFGGWYLITSPDGSSLGMPLSVLQYSPFTDFFIPGIILLVMVGAFSYVALIKILFHKKNYQLYVIGEGFILTAWIVIQMFLIHDAASLHYMFGSIGILLIISGFSLRK